MSQFPHTLKTIGYYHCFTFCQSDNKNVFVILVSIMLMKSVDIYILFFFCLHHTACGILVPQQGIEPRPSALKAWSPNHWTTREFPQNCCCLVIQSCPTLWPYGLQKAYLSFTISQSLLKLMFIESMMPSYDLILCCPLLLLASVFPSICVFQWIGSSLQVVKALEIQLQPQSFQWIFGVDFL